MKVQLTSEFINDLRESKDARFVTQVLSHTIDDNGDLYLDKDDHPYKGMENAWIRYISKGNTGWRVIYIQKGGTAYLHRAGPHSIEQKARTPRDASKSIPVTKLSPTFQIAFPNDFGTFLKTCEPEYLNRHISSMYHVGHHEIILVSPFLSQNLVNRFHPFGRFLDKAIEENTYVTLITAPPEASKLAMFEDLVARNFFVYFRESLHAKLYMFDINQATLNNHYGDMPRVAIVGSSNLTESGFGLDEGVTNDELCFKLPEERFDDAKRFVDSLLTRSIDYQTYKIRNKRN